MKNTPKTPQAAARRRAAIDERLDQELFRALSDRTRLRLLACLIKCGRPCSVTEIAEACAVDFSVVNKHLKVLAATGILASDKRGRVVWYAARCGDLSRRLAALIDAIAEWCPNLSATSPPPERASGATCCDATPRKEG